MITIKCLASFNNEVKIPLTDVRRCNFETTPEMLKFVFGWWEVGSPLTQISRLIPELKLQSKQCKQRCFSTRISNKHLFFSQDRYLFIHLFLVRQIFFLQKCQQRQIISFTLIQSHFIFSHSPKTRLFFSCIIQIIIFKKKTKKTDTPHQPATPQKVKWSVP